VEAAATAFAQEDVSMDPSVAGSVSALAVEDAPTETDAADEAAGARASGAGHAALAKGQAAVEVTSRESKRMLLLRSPFVEAIDFTVVPAESRVLLSQPPENDGDLEASTHDEKLLGVKQLRSLILDVYVQKHADDARRDKILQPRRQLHVLLQEHIRRTHGVKNVVHQKSWQLIESVLRHSSEDKTVELFVDFLDGSRDIDELSFYLYCSTLLSTQFAEDSYMAQQTRFQEGFISFTRAVSLVELLFSDLPKALTLVKAELEKVVVMDAAAEQDARNRLQQQVKEGAIMSTQAFNEGIAHASLCLLTDHLYQVLLEGWRHQALLLDNSLSGFSWRLVVLAFVQADVGHRGWLDRHEVQEAEERRLHVDAYGNQGLVLQDRVSFGAFVFRAAHRCMNSQAHGMEPSPPNSQAPSSSRPQGVAAKQRVSQRKAAEAVLHVSKTAFEFVSKSLEVYLKWMMHSEELRDLAVYRSVKSQIFSFKQALGADSAAMGAHHLRSLLLLLIAHQSDIQYQQEDVDADFLDWELRSLMTMLRECWKRNAILGPELEAIGDTEQTGPGSELPPELRKNIESAAKQVVQCGPKFEELLMRSKKDDPGFAFLHGGEGSDYFQHLLESERAQPSSGF
jgi:hypothetical protein